VPRAADLKAAVHEVDPAVVREALPLVEAHEVLPSTGGGRPARDVVAAALAR